MIDAKLLREQSDAIQAGLAKRGSRLDLNRLLEKEAQRRKLLTEIEQLRQEQKKASEAFGRAKAQGSKAPPEDLKRLSQEIKDKEQSIRPLEEELNAELALIPNVPHESVPAGDESNNQILRDHGQKKTFDFEPKDHIALSESLGLIDFARAAKISGANFALYTGAGARLERALIQWMLDVQTQEHGYTEISPPFLVNRASMFGTGQLPKFEEDMYRLQDDDLFLVPTAEVPVTNIHRDEILNEADLPLTYTAYTPCFRREAGSYGKETRGLVRLHQFDKVELVRFVKPEESYDQLELLVGHAESILQRLGLHYRVVLLAAGDLGFSAAKCYDLEVWAPGTGSYLEVSSCSNFEAFQARRAQVRYRPEGSKKVQPVHTLNGSGLALARCVIALLETYQTADGHIEIPEVLRPYLGGQQRL